MKKKLFKSKTQMVIYLILTVIIFALFIVIGQIDFKKDKVSDSIRFSNTYNLVDKDNVFVFSNATDILNILKGRSGVILFGFPDNKWMNNYAKLLNECAKEVGINKIYYYNFLKDRKESNATYETIVKKLSDYVYVNDQGKQELLAPSIVVIKNGNVLAYSDKLSMTRKNNIVEDYFNEFNKYEIINEFKNILIKYINEE